MKKKKMVRDARFDYWNYPNINRIVEAALYYGFTPLNAIAVEKQDKEHGHTFTPDLEPDFPMHIEERLALVRTFFLKPHSNPPTMTVCRHNVPRRHEFVLDIIGTQRPIADATVIKTAYEAAKCEGYEDLCVELNSVGDRESLTRYTRELTAYYRKYISDLHPDCRQTFKKNPFQILSCNHEKCLMLRERSPHIMSYLSEPSRDHFKELLEYVEMTGMTYSINNSLIKDSGIALHTVFSMYGREEGKKEVERLAWGMRWTGLAKKIGLKKDVPGVSAVISLKKHDSKCIKKIRKPQFYFIQMGQEAKLKSLNLIESLRQSKIPIYHSLTKDKLTAQLSSAEYLRVPYILIMGQKESLDNTILIREMSTRSQDTVRMDRAADYLKKLIS